MSEVNGIGAQLEKFDFLFGVMLGEKLLRLADNLSCTLQQKDLSVAEGNQAALLTCETLSALCSDSEFVKFWDKITAKQGEVSVEEPTLQRVGAWLQSCLKSEQGSLIFPLQWRCTTELTTLKL